MTIAFELMIFAAVFVVAIALFAIYMTSSDREKRNLIASHESRRLAHQPWDTDKSNRRGNR